MTEPSNWLPNNTPVPHASEPGPKRSRPTTRSSSASPKAYLAVFVVTALVVGAFIWWDSGKKDEIAGTGEQITSFFNKRNVVLARYITGYEDYAGGVAVQVDLAGSGLTYKAAAGLLCYQLNQRDFATDTDIYIQAPDTLDPAECTR